MCILPGFGLFTDVSYETDQNLKNILGHLAYLVEAGKRIFNVPTYRIKVDAGVKKLEGEYIFGMITMPRLCEAASKILPEPEWNSTTACLR